MDSETLILAALEIASQEDIDREAAMKVLLEMRDGGNISSVPSSPFRDRKSLYKSAGTCKQGERSDLTGCTPASGDGSSHKPEESKPSDPETKATETLSTYQRTLKRIKSVPVLKQASALGDVMRAVTKKVYEKLEQRYGKKTAIACMASGQAVGWGSSAIGAIIGVPIYIPGSTLLGSLPAVTLAELFLQLKKIGGKSMDDELLKQALAEMNLELRTEYETYLREHKEEIIVALEQAAKEEKGVPPSPFRDRKSFQYRVKEVTNGTCEQGERADLTGCIPANKKPSTDTKPKKQEEEDVSFEKKKAVRGKMTLARRVGTGKEARIVLADGKPAPSHIKPAMVPPDWTDVRVSLDPKAELLVTAKDNKGRMKSVYSDAFHMRNAALKFARVDEMIRKSPEIDRQIQEARKDPATKDVADCSWLMSVQATRPGSDSDTGGKVKAYGATTLEGRHVKQTKAGVRLQFVGKEGVYHDHLIRDPELAKMLVERSKKAGKNGRLFDTNAHKVNAFIEGLDGGHFSAKDFRTRRANLIAASLVKQNMSPPTSDKEYKQRIKEVAEQVSHVLGNRPQQALESYINPAVFSVWQVMK